MADDDEICAECKCPRPQAPEHGVAIRLPGTLHHDWCPTLPRLTGEAKRELERRFQEIRDAEAGAMANAHNVWIR